MMLILRQALFLFIAMSVLTGIAYPLAVTAAAQLLFAHEANGSVIVRDGKTLGSALIGQPFADPKYFWPRPSATSPSPNNATASGGSNLGPTNPALADAVKARIAALHTADPGNSAAVPVDLVSASASGLDPDISPAAAQYQIARVARVRGIPLATVAALVERATRSRQLAVLGEPRVNVLELNLALDAN